MIAKNIIKEVIGFEKWVMDNYKKYHEPTIIKHKFNLLKQKYDMQ